MIQNILIKNANMLYGLHFRFRALLLIHVNNAVELRFMYTLPVSLGKDLCFRPLESSNTSSRVNCATIASKPFCTDATE